MTKKHKISPRKLLIGVGVCLSMIGSGFALNFAIRPYTTEEKIVEKEKIIDAGVRITLPETLPKNVYNDKGELNPDDIYPYVESVDGGQFLDITENLPENDGGFAALGSIEVVDTSSPEAFVSSTLGKCIIADNYFGAQCVSLQRAFWWNYAGYDVTTCGTGVAKGEALCPEELARDKFKIINSSSEIIAGTFIVTDGSWTGHVCMALDKPVNGYVRCLGENQGGRSCGENVGGSATNIINLSVRQFLVGFIPLTYIPKPNVLPDTSH